MTLSPHLLNIDDEPDKTNEKAIEAEKEEIKPDVPQLGIKDLFRDSEVRKITLIMFVNWIVVTLGYYGISMGAANLGGDVFVSNILLALIEVPSYIFCILIMDYWGRKPIFVR